MDDNGKPIYYGVSHIDGVTPVAIAFNPTNRAMLLDLATAIEFNATQGAASTNRYLFAKATSDAGTKTILPWVVNASTGAVLATET